MITKEQINKFISNHGLFKIGNSITFSPIDSGYMFLINNVDEDDLVVTPCEKLIYLSNDSKQIAYCGVSFKQIKTIKTLEKYYLKFNEQRKTELKKYRINQIKEL